MAFRIERGVFKFFDDTERTYKKAFEIDSTGNFVLARNTNMFAARDDDGSEKELIIGDSREVQGTGGLEEATATSMFVSQSGGTITGNLTVGGRITAQEFHTEFVNSTIIREDGDVEVDGNIYFTGSATTTNQSHGIYWTGFDKEGVTDFSDTAYITHTTNTGGFAGSVLVIHSANDANDGIAFSTNASSPLKHNGNVIWSEGNALYRVTSQDVNAATRTTWYSNYTSGDAANRIRNHSTVYTLGGVNTLQFSTNTDYDETALWFRQYNNNAASPNGAGWQRWAKVWTDLNDGAGSGLNADTVDGIQASSFLRSDASDSTTGTITSTAATGFSVDSPSYARIILDATNNWSYIRFSEEGTTIWDIASYNRGALEWRPGGGTTNKMSYTSGGVLTTGDGFTSTKGNTAYGWGDHSTAGYQSDTTPTAPTLHAKSTNGAGIAITINAGANAQYYEIWSSIGDQDNFGMVGKIDPSSTASRMSYQDNTMTRTGTIYYRIYSVYKGIYSSPLEFNHAFSYSVADPASVNIASNLDTFMVSWEQVDKRLLASYTLRHHATSGTPAFASSTTIYTGKNEFFFYSIPDDELDLNHQFWVTSNTSS